MANRCRPSGRAAIRGRAAQGPDRRARAAGAAGLPRRRCRGSPHRVRQRRKSVAGTRHGPATRDRDASLDRCDPRTSRSPDPDGVARAGACGRRDRCAAGRNRRVADQEHGDGGGAGDLSTHVRLDDPAARPRGDGRSQDARHRLRSRHDHERRVRPLTRLDPLARESRRRNGIAWKRHWTWRVADSSGIGRRANGHGHCAARERRPARSQLRQAVRRQQRLRPVQRHHVQPALTGPVLDRPQGRNGRAAADTAAGLTKCERRRLLTTRRAHRRGDHVRHVCPARTKPRRDARLADPLSPRERRLSHGHGGPSARRARVELARRCRCAAGDRDEPVCRAPVLWRREACRSGCRLALEPGGSPANDRRRRRRRRAPGITDRRGVSGGLRRLSPVPVYPREMGCKARSDRTSWRSASCRSRFAQPTIRRRPCPSCGRSSAASTPTSESTRWSR